MRVHLWLRRFPIILGMVLLLLPWGLEAANRAAGVITPAEWVITEHRLAGVEPPIIRPVMSVSGVWSGSFQKNFATYLDHSLPLLASAVGLKNQIYYSLFRLSDVQGIVLGKHGQLFENAYIDEYCGRHGGANPEGGEHWAEELAQMQAWYEAQGKVFIYVITPSKAATYPQYLPNGHACRSTPTDRDARGPAWDAMLDRHGVRYVDAASLVRQRKLDYPFEMFPLGGTHWNDVAAALAAQAIIRSINAAPMHWKLQDFSFSWRMVPPTGVARDLTDMLNLPFPRLNYRVPAVSLIPTPSAACSELMIGAVGGSFTFEIISTIMALPCAPQIDFYEYFHTERAFYPGDIRGPVDARQQGDLLLNRAQIVLLEENEQVMIRSEHGPAFYDMVAAQRRP